MIRFFVFLMFSVFIFPSLAFSNAALLFAIDTREWHKAEQILITDETADPDIAFSENPGATALWRAAFAERWDLVRLMLIKKPKANVDATPTKGHPRNHGKTVLWLAAQAHRFELIWWMLSNNPQANLGAGPVMFPNQSVAAILAHDYATNQLVVAQDAANMPAILMKMALIQIRYGLCLVPLAQLIIPKLDFQNLMR